MDAEETLSRVRELVGAPAPVVPSNWDELLAQAKVLPAAIKIKLVEAMGFVPVGLDHQPDCPTMLGRGNRHNCVPPATQWSAPRDVLEERGETWEQRRRRAHGEGREWPAVGATILVQDRLQTDAQRELNRQPPTRRGVVIESPADGDDHLVIDTGGEYGGITYGRDFGTRYTWKLAQ
jgi:hypothetical protein